VRWIVHGLLLVALATGIFGVLPRLGGLTRDAVGLRHARPAFLAAAIVAQAASLGCYAQLYRRVNASALESEGVAAATTGEAIGLTSLMSTVALIVLFRLGVVATSGRHISHQYLVIAGIALFLVMAALAVVLAVGSHPPSPARVAGPVRAYRTCLPGQLRARVRRPALRPALARPGVPRAAVPARRGGLKLAAIRPLKLGIGRRYPFSRSLVSMHTARFLE
jgi:hypothetical protein